MKATAAPFVFFVNGVLLMILAGVMAVPALADLAAGSSEWQIFAASAGITLFAGTTMALTNTGMPKTLDRRAHYLLTATSWIVVGGFSSLPFALGPHGLSLTDAVFETMSGLTTTGSTVLTGLDGMAPGILLWRSLLQWIGGIGIVVMAILLLPPMRVGGMQLFRTESSDVSGKTVPRFYQLVLLILAAYAGLTAACTVGYRVAGMGWFDAVNHAMTTLSTGGYSTKDSSIGFYDSPAIEAVGIVFMISGALPLIFYARLAMDRREALARERQVAPYLLTAAAAVALVAAWNYWANDMPPATAIRQSAFNVVSILTDTGYASTDFSTWGSFAVGIFFLLYFIGGCAGSTASGIKMFRWQLLFLAERRQLVLSLSPNRVVIVRHAGQKIDADMLASVRNFFFMYIMTFIVLSLACMATGMDVLSSTSSIAQGMANAGPGLGPLVGPATNFAAIPDTAKWVIVAAMLLGRLELTTIYALLLADFWRR